MLTNAHVVGSSKSVVVRWSDGIETPADVIRISTVRDIALIKTQVRSRSPLRLEPGTMPVGRTVFAVGAPLDRKYQGTVTRGVVSASRIIDGLSYVQSDVTVNPGNSGGPLLNESGSVVGVTDLGFQPDGLPTGINLFIPIGDALDFLNLKTAP
jgi:serine protease Do